MTNKTILFEAEIDGKKFKATLNEMKNQGDKAFGGAEKGARSLGTRIGRVAGVTAALTATFLDLARNATAAFADIAKQAVELNKEAELTRISLVQIFSGNEKAADAFIGKIKDMSVLLGRSRTELTSLAKGILPDVGDVDTTLEIVKNVSILGRDANKQIADIRTATEEALSGNVKSLVRRLNVPDSVRISVERYAETMSIAEAVARALAEQVERAGLSAESTSDSLATVQGRLENQLEDLQRALGTSISDELKEQFKEIGAALEGNDPLIQNAVRAFGDLAAQVVELIGSGIVDFIKNIDLKGIEEFADKFSDLVVTADLFLKTLDVPDGFNSLIEGATNLLNTLQEALFTASQLSVIAQSKAAGIEARFQKRVELGITDERGRTRRAITDEDQAAIDAAGEAAQRKVVEKSLAAFEKFNKELEENTKQTRARRDATKDGTDADLESANAALAQEKALRELAEAEDEARKAKEKIADATEKLNKARDDSALTLEIRQQRRLTDALLDNARAREDIARANVQEIADIQRDSQQDIADAAKDLSRDEQQIARDGARRQSQIAKDEANGRLDIERDFRQQLEQIRRTFEQSAIEAERANDAIAFTRAVRQRDNSIADATATRDSNLEETRIQAQQQREALRVELKNELEDARINNRQKLEDLRERLNRELEEQQIKNQRDLEEQAITEARKEADRIERNARELADFERQQAIKLERLNDSLKKEFEAILAAEKAKTALIESEHRKRLRFASTTSLQRAVTVGQARSGRGIQQFAAGGVPPVGRASLVGERGPELFVPNTSGRIIPNSQLFSPPALRAMAGNVTNINNNGGNANVSMTPDLLNDPIMKQRLIEMVTNEIAGGLR